jgi:hypothetical protein
MAAGIGPFPPKGLRWPTLTMMATDLTQAVQVATLAVHSNMATDFSIMAILEPHVATLEGGHFGRRWQCYNDLAVLGDSGHLSGAEQ